VCRRKFYDLAAEHSEDIATAARERILIH